MADGYALTEPERRHVSRLVRDLQGAQERLYAVLQFIAEREHMAGTTFDINRMVFVRQQLPVTKSSNPESM